MAKFLIEVNHNGDKYGCKHSVEIFHTTGSHFLTNADWGCLDGVHKAWFVMEAGNKSEALKVVPSAYRKDTIIIQLNKFNPRDFEELGRSHNM